MNPPPPSPAAPQRPRTSRPKLVLCAVLIATPVILALAVPLYQRVEPTLMGIPFFYWFQMTMAVAAAGGCGASYFIAFRNEPESGADQ
ncbi:DUF3311 domain-containing protein [Mycobacterium sp. 21AC1]|uniref:DUF3311 domain-containing protein n=1 Tax=[Mycobacterium] appelbergii TaxID=2939269 RepID=UPI0029393FB4|nr:DUF3311 domain-containing protein [Mycobacterium sp. 21AC1]MDV3125949.1 DUF3311 domain-containing protein [Mycobacterium sp. 21AC1]